MCYLHASCFCCLFRSSRTHKHAGSWYSTQSGAGGGRPKTIGKNPTKNDQRGQGKNYQTTFIGQTNEERSAEQAPPEAVLLGLVGPRIEEKLIRRKRHYMLEASCAFIMGLQSISLRLSFNNDQSQTLRYIAA